MNTAAMRARARDESGFTMLLALGVMFVTMLLLSALFVAVNGDNGLTRADTDGKQAYAAAQAGAQAYLFDLNHNAQDSNWWQDCGNDSTTAPVAVNASSSYTFQPVKACVTGGAIGTVLDPSTGQLRIAFTGTSGSAHRTVVAAFRTLTPLSYLWFTDHETVDSAIVPDCTDYYANDPRIDPACEINWFGGDVVHGPMYTHDQYLIGGSPGDEPQFGDGPSDTIASSAGKSSVCVLPSGNGVTQATTCPAGVIHGTEDPHAAYIDLPSDNANLRQDASQYGLLLTGTTTITLDGATMSYVNCPVSNAPCSPQVGPIPIKPIVYVATGAGCSEPAYQPQATGSQSASSTPNSKYYSCGNVYLNGGTYSSGLTISAARNIIVRGSVTDSSQSGGMPSGTAALGLVADNYVRVAHDVSGNGCGATAAPNVTIDAAILTLQHSFFVDNYNCGYDYGRLTVNGAIAQRFRGIVGTAGPSGYLKDYSYDTRLSYIMPPYMFDLEQSSWTMVRQTLCGTNLPSADTASCTAP